MRVKIEFTVAVDPVEWDETYGCGSDAASVRDDVKRWAANAVSHHPDGLVEFAYEPPQEGS
jgi:hypothetical protein